MFAMTDAQQVRVHPFRAPMLTPRPFADAARDPDEGARRVATWWTVKEILVPKYNKRDFWSRGTALASPDLQPILRGAVAAFDNPSAPAMEVGVEAAMLSMLDYENRRGVLWKNMSGGDNARYAPIDAWFVRRWVTAGGLPFALRVLAEYPRYDLDRANVGDPDTFALLLKPRESPGWNALQTGNLALVGALRRAVVSASDDAYAAGVAAAGELRATAPLFLRAAIAFAFPDESFGHEDLAAAVPEPHSQPSKAAVKSSKPKSRGTKTPLGPELWGLVTTRLDEAELPALVRGVAGDPAPFRTDTSDYGLTLVHRLGDGTAPHLVAAVKAAKEPYAREGFADALALTTAETRAFFESRLGKGGALGKLAKAYLERSS